MKCNFLLAKVLKNILKWKTVYFHQSIKFDRLQGLAISSGLEILKRTEIFVWKQS